MAISTHRRTRPSRPTVLALVAVAGAIALATVTQLAAALPDAAIGLDEPLLAGPVDGMPVEPDGLAASGASGASGASDAAGSSDPELGAIREEVAFWAARLDANPRDLVAAVRVAEASAAEAHLTGDLGGYVRALAAADTALRDHPAYVPAQAARASVLVALHRFGEATVAAEAILEREPTHPAALGVLGDAALETGDLRRAGSAYQALRLVDGSSASLVRDGRLAWVRGDTTTALGATTAAVSAARDEGLGGGALAFFHVTLGNLHVATGNAAGARRAFEDALAVRPGLPTALVGLARIDAFEGDLDAAVASLDAALAAIPTPEWLALRADLLERRGGPGDASAADADLATIEAIAVLGAEAGSVYDRALARHLADRAIDPARAVELARAELAVRRDVYGHDTLAWALFAAGDVAGADRAMRDALAAGTQDAGLWYHAGVIAAAAGRADEARAFLEDALALGPALDPAARERALVVLESLR